MSDKPEQLQLVDSQLPRPTRKRLRLDDLPGNEDLLGPDPEAPFRESLATFGQQVPIMVEASVDGGYVVAAGRRRIKALRQLEEKDILADVYPTGSNVASLLAVIENEHRRDNPANTYVAMRALMKEHKIKDARELGKLLGISGNRVDRLMKLTSLVDALEDAFIAGDISQSAAFAAVRLPTAVQKNLAKTFKKDGRLTTETVRAAQQVEVQKGVAGLDDDVFNTPATAADEPAWPLFDADDEEYDRADLHRSAEAAVEGESVEMIDAQGRYWQVTARVTIEIEPARLDEEDAA